MRLNLGCYDKKLPGFVNVDIRPEVKPDRIDNCFTLDTFEDNSVSLIYSSHMLEHLSYDHAVAALKIWRKKLKTFGTLRLAVPDIEKACSLYLMTKDISIVKTMFWGSQKHEYDYHYHGWDKKTLTKTLSNLGFCCISEWDWTKTKPHNYIDDYSQCYWPNKVVHYENGKIKEVDGILLSLNIQAIKP